MPLVRTFLQLAAGVALMASALAPAPAFARTAYDGQWSVLIVTNSGPCDRAYRYGLSIQNGAVIYEGSAAVNVAGKVANNGAVKVRVWAGQQGASGTGRLSRTDGSGTWRGTGSMGTCSGVWSAERRG
ncbi:MAG: hypothetical protein JO000_29285 [Alphaproteobacteria bacterium]|nr:hypothetical protein [Alphaproteobacteria bacterium]